MKLRVTVVSMLVLALGASSPGSAVAVPNVVDQYTELPPAPGGTTLPPGGNNTSAGGSDDSNAGSNAVQLPDGRTVGELGDDTASEARAGQVILIGTSSWRIQEVAGGRVIVTPAPGAVPELEGAGQEQVVVGSSSLGLGFPVLLLVTAAAIAALAYGSRRSASSVQS